ncbi:MAG TPA: hypothetical protein VIX90_03435 [Edaphobacter sp.]
MPGYTYIMGSHTGTLYIGVTSANPWSRQPEAPPRENSRHPI